MRIGIVSDSHGNHGNVVRALQLLAARGVERIVHCGDIDDAATVALFEEVPTHFGLGNCDTNVPALTLAASHSGATVHGRFAELEWAGKRIALIHGGHQQMLGDTERSNPLD